MNRVVVIVAAGSGQRMAEPNKALLLIVGEPAIVHSIRAAARALDVSSIVVVTREDLVEEITAIVRGLNLNLPVSVVVGGVTRTDSVANGVRALAELDATLVAVHDAARPLVTTAQFNAVFAAVEAGGGAIIAAPVVDTLKRVRPDGAITETVDRADLWAAQTPQAFRVDDLVSALDHARINELSMTDEAGLYERLGWPVKIVPGDASNLKMTYPSDHALASFLFERRAAQEESSK